MAAGEDVETVFRRLSQEIEKIKGATIGGLLAGGLIIQRQAQKWVPVEYGKLRASAFTRRAAHDPAAVEVGFSASYAIYVHENVEAKLRGQPRPSGLGRYWGPDGRPRFLSAAATEKREEVLEAIAKRARNRGAEA